MSPLGANLFAAAAVAGLLAGAHHGPTEPAPLTLLRASLAAADDRHACPAEAGLKGSVADHGTAAAGGSAVTLTAGDFYFEPTCLSGVPPAQVEVQVKNTGRLLHNISFEDQGIDQDVGPGETVVVRVKMGKEPRQFSCKYHRGAGMVGALLPR